MADTDAELTLRRRVGARIKAAREAEGLTQEHVAQRVGMVRSSIANLEAGRQDMNISRLALVAAAVKLNLADLIRPEDLPELPPPPPPPHEVTIRLRLGGRVPDMPGRPRRVSPCRPRSGPSVTTSP